MISVTFIHNAYDTNMSLLNIDKIITNLNEFCSAYKVIKNEMYDKLENSYRTICNIETKCELSETIANKLLGKIADKWEWDECKSSAWSCKNTMKSVFVYNYLIFVNCWFEDLEL